MPGADQFRPPLQLTFLNLSKEFNHRVDWNFMEYGKLWNYNLQYFDYLNDDKISDKDKQCLIDDFVKQLLEGKIKPEPYPVSLRLINWILYYSKSLFHSKDFEKAIFLQADYLRKNLEFHIQANHLLENYISLFVAGYGLHNKELTAFAGSGIEKELKEQILPDGGHYECTPMYHSIILGRLLMLIDMIRSNDWLKFDETKLRSQVERMLGWLDAFCWKNGDWASVNDATPGIAPIPAQLFDAARQLNITWQKPALNQCGFRKLANVQFEILVDAGNIIPRYQPGHAHSDALSFCLNYKNDPVIVDTGISTYQENEVRLEERKTSAHNTVLINNSDQSEVWSAFRVGKRANCRIHLDEQDKIKAEHDGYYRRYGVKHLRSVHLNESGVVIEDSLLSTGGSAGHIALLHFDHRIKPKIAGKQGLSTENGLRISFENADNIELGEYEQAAGFNKKIKATVAKVYFSGSLLTKFHA